MVYDYLISVPKAGDPVWTEENPGPLHLHRVGEYSTNWVYDCRSSTDPMLLPEFATSTLLGSWDFEGVAQSAIHPDYYLIRPLGNAEVEGDDGIATGALQYSYGAGWRQRYLQETPVVNTLATYPADVQPISLTMERRFDDTVGFEGEGWIATIEFSDPTREPNVRAIGIYDADWNYLYTTGAFIWTEVEPEQEVLDEDGNPTGEVIPAVFKWQTVNPPGRVTVVPEPIHYALLYASLQEGRMTLEASAQGRTDLFWDQNQSGAPLPPLGDTWTDSGQVVAGNFGTVTGVSGDKNEFPVGSMTRIEGLEATVTEIWAGGDGIILDPYRAYTVGAMIEQKSAVQQVTNEGVPVTFDGEGVTTSG